MSENPYTRKPPEIYEEYTQAEKNSICPFYGGPCVKDPQLCRFWQPFLVVKQTILNTFQNEDIYMCLFDIYRTSLTNLLLLMQGQAAQAFMRSNLGEGPGKQQAS